MLAPLQLAMLLAIAAVQEGKPPVKPVAHVDLERYAGRWYEIARFPNRFQAKCVGETTADYSLLPDGAIRVLNSCRRGDGGSTQAEGRARLATRGGPSSVLKVRFAPAFLSFLPFVWGDYWILDLTEDYGAALVGSPDRKYLWILARTPTLDEATYGRLVATARAQGFAVERLVPSPGQTAPAKR